ncbi:hypothetical protein SASPL_102633 [Salvia splendens]|uniref:2Fe-2S ferredoxin n=1 Tax=Salvia splendens TaxID=180675 RepID=A0A8X8YWB1_SALSN|nr:hypothetical protein SASPL_102633 [Salvia splendens]
MGARNILLVSAVSFASQVEGLCSFRAATLTVRTSYTPKAHNQYLGSLVRTFYLFHKLELLFLPLFPTYKETNFFAVQHLKTRKSRFCKPNIIHRFFHLLQMAKLSPSVMFEGCINFYVSSCSLFRVYRINVIFCDKDGEETHIKVPVGMSMLEAAHENDIELEGACEGSLACSTCHVIVMDVDQYNKLSEPTDEENDMLDLAFGLSETSRLGCQIIAKPELDGLRLAIPAATRNFAVDGFKPKPH